MTVDESLRSLVAAEVAPLALRIERLAALVEKLQPPQFVSIDETAKRLSCSAQTVTAMCRRGELVHRRAGRRVLVDASSLRPADPSTVSRLSREARS